MNPLFKYLNGSDSRPVASTLKVDTTSYSLSQVTLVFNVLKVTSNMKFNDYRHFNLSACSQWLVILNQVIPFIAASQVLFARDSFVPIRVFAPR